jgi:uncharacterized membrane protein
MSTPPAGRSAAQQRADRIRAFRDELNALRADGLTLLSAEQEAQVARHHDAVLAGLAARFDVDVSEGAGRLSRGMQIASFFGAITLCAAIYSLVARFWGHLDLPLQVGLLTLFPVLALAGVDIAARREPSLYVASIFAAAAYSTFWLAAVFTTHLLDVPLTIQVWWLGVVFGLSLAMAYGFRLVLVASLVALVVALAGTLFTMAGAPWTSAGMQLEPSMVAGFGVLLLAPGLETAAPGLGAVTRQVALAIGLATLLTLSMNGELSVWPAPSRWLEAFYQVVMLLVCLAAIVAGLRWRVPDVVNMASIGLALFLATRYFDWFWEVLPRFVFFLVLAVAAFGWLLALRRVRSRLGIAEAVSSGRS